MRWVRVTSLGIVLSVGCYRTPSAKERLQESVIVTARDKEQDFGAFSSFFVRPEIRILQEGGGILAPAAEEVPADVAEPLLLATKNNLVDRGYTESPLSEDADLGIDLVYAREIDGDDFCEFQEDLAYWGFGGWFYYFPFSCGATSWQAGMLVTHAIDLQSGREQRAERDVEQGVLYGAWFSGVYGLEDDSVSLVADRAVLGIDEAFDQSPYFTRLTE